MNRFPEKIWEIIFSYLSPLDMITCSHVSGLVNQRVSTSRWWEHLCTQERSKATASKAVAIKGGGTQVNDWKRKYIQWYSCRSTLSLLLLPLH